MDGLSLMLAVFVAGATAITDCDEGAVHALFASRRIEQGIERGRPAAANCADPVIAARLYRSLAYAQRSHGSFTPAGLEALERAADLGHPTSMIDLAAAWGKLETRLDDAALWAHRAMGYATTEGEWKRARATRDRVYAVIQAQGIEPASTLGEAACQWAPQDPSGALSLDTDAQIVHCLAAQLSWVPTP